MTEPIPFIPTEPAPKKTVRPEPNEAAERAKFNEVKTKAAVDKHLQALKQKMDAATADGDIKQTAREYYKALFTKMRKMDPSIKDHVDRMETAVMKRIDAGKPVGD